MGDGQHTGGMVALLPADPDALTVPGGDPADEMHCTLAFLGDVTTWTDERADAVRALAAALAAGTTALDAQVVGTATFAPGDPDRQCAVHLVGDTPDLAPLQQRVHGSLAALLGDDLPAQHSPTIFRITAGYGLTAADLPGNDGAEPPGPLRVRFDRLAVVLAGQWTTWPLSAVSATETAAVRETDDDVPGDDDPDDELTDDDLQRLADAALAAVADQRTRTHDAAKLALLALLAQVAAGIDHQAVTGAYTRGADRATNRAAVAAALADAVDQAGLSDTWDTVVRDAHSAATAAGASAAMHVLTAGGIDVNPTADDIAAVTADDEQWDPGDWITDQTGALAGDIVNVLDAADEQDDIDVTAVVAAGAGAWLMLDMQVSDAYLAATVLIYGLVGIADYYWNTMTGACDICINIESASPHTSPPAAPHPMCRCWITVGAASRDIDDVVVA